MVESLLKVTDIPMDCHLMIEDPDRWAPAYAEAGAYNVTFMPKPPTIGGSCARHPCGGRPRRTFGETRHPLEPYPRDPARLRHSARQRRWSLDSAVKASFPRCWQRSGLRADLSMRGVDHRRRDRRRHQRRHHRSGGRSGVDCFRRRLGGIWSARPGCSRRSVAAQRGGSSSHLHL